MRRALVVTALAVLGVAPCADVAAEETAVYESLATVIVGRVFLTPAQRARLDAARRSDAPPIPAAGKPNGSRSSPASSKAAGYIIAASGQARVYRDGDFVAVSVTPAVRFPNAVEVVRGPGPACAREGTDDGCK